MRQAETGGRQVGVSSVLQDLSSTTIRKPVLSNPNPPRSFQFPGILPVLSFPLHRHSGHDVL